METGKPEDRRRDYRIVYPLAARPRITLADGRQCSVVDSSAGGVRIVADKAWPPPEGVDIQGELKLCSGTVSKVLGRAVWVSERVAAIRFAPDSGIRMADILAEQRWLRARFPAAR
jgi:hypothetical protein